MESNFCMPDNLTHLASHTFFAFLTFYYFFDFLKSFFILFLVSPVMQFDFKADIRLGVLS